MRIQEFDVELQRGVRGNDTTRTAREGKLAAPSADARRPAETAPANAASAVSRLRRRMPADRFDRALVDDGRGVMAKPSRSGHCCHCNPTRSLIKRKAGAYRRGQAR